VEIVKMYQSKKTLTEISETFGVSIASLSRHFSNYRRQLIRDSAVDLDELYKEDVCTVNKLRAGVMACAFAALDDIKDQYSQGTLVFSPDDFCKFAFLAVKLASTPNEVETDALDKTLEEMKQRRLALPTRQQALGFVNIPPKKETEEQEEK
jgi:uncharacterized protein YerC